MHIPSHYSVNAKNNPHMCIKEKLRFHNDIQQFGIKIHKNLYNPSVLN